MGTKRTLAGIELISGLGEDERRELESICRWRRYRLGETIFDRGSEGREVYFVVEGGVNIVSFSLTGREIRFAIAKSGDFFGEMAAIDERPRSASIVAEEDSLIAVLPAEPFISLLKRRGDITFTLLQRLSANVRDTDDQVVELSGMEDMSRICSALLRMAKIDDTVDDLWTIRPMPGLRDLARDAGTNREAVNRSLTELYGGGLLKRKGDSLYLMDRKALEHIVSSG